MKEVGNHTIVKPDERKKRIEDFLQKTFNDSTDQHKITFQLNKNKIVGY